MHSELETSPVVEPEGPPDNLKERINLLLWELLPAHVTIGNADALACRIVHLIEAEWEK